MKELHIIRHNEFIALGHAVSFIGAYCGVITCEQLRLCSKQNQLKMLTRQMLLFFMAVANGGVAIWCTHLVGMSAVSFVDMDGNPVPNYYRLDFTIISLIISILFYFIGVNICSKDGAFVMDKMDTVNAFIEGATRMTISEIRKMRSKRDILLLSLFHRMQRLVVGTMITALGMSSMHFLGMTSLIIDRKVQIKWDVPLVIASVAVQIVSISD